MVYDHKGIDKKWQEYWLTNKTFKTSLDKSKDKYYVLDMFPYPSGAGLHVGHPEGYTASDILSRYKRMKGFNVLHPMGWDAFGLPAENYAIKTGEHPSISTRANIANFKRQIQSIGFSYDWDREIDTTDPDYYKWTQWIFLKLFDAGLAYEELMPINWCPSCKTGLANEEVIDGICDRCKTQVEKKEMKQWMLKITLFAERLLKDLDLLTDWPEPIKEMQRNWIGKSEGCEFEMKSDNGKVIRVYTTRIDTVFGMTYAVIAPDHPGVMDFIKNEDCLAYIEKSKNKSDLERTGLEKEKTGVFTGSYVINPFNSEKVPLWVGDYVLGYYGTGAVMAVPAHDERDFEFAIKYNLPIKRSIAGGDIDKTAYTNYGILHDSGEFSGLNSEDAIRVMIEYSQKHGFGTKKVNYKLRDWVFSRQRYWGEPIPIIKCSKCGNVGVPEEELPVMLPDVKNYKPSGTGESPLVNVESWVNVKCPRCLGEAKRETNTMPQWAGSSWYYLRFKDPANRLEMIDREVEKYWGGVDMYVGGAEHAVLHLLYARFWHKVLFDYGLVSTKEPFIALRNQGLILAEDGLKMSKSLGNVINPDDVIEEYGADTFRMYEMFMGPFDQSKKWDTKGIAGIRRFLEKVFKLQYIVGTSEVSITKLLHKTIKKVGLQIEDFKFNTAISDMMIFVNEVREKGSISKADLEGLLLILSPFAPHICEDIWATLGHKQSLALESWPKYMEEYCKDDTLKIAVQVNGKLRGEISILVGTSKEEVLTKAKQEVSKYLTGDIKKEVYVEGKIVSFVV